MPPEAVISIVDDDDAVRNGIDSLRRATVRGLGPLCSESDRVFAFTVDYPFFSARSRQRIKSGSLMGLAHKSDCAVAHVLVRVSRD